MKKNEPIRVAVYGTLLTGEGNYRVGTDALDRKPCRMSGTLYDPNGGWYPAFVPDGSEAFNVAGEVLTTLDTSMTTNAGISATRNDIPTIPYMDGPVNAKPITIAMMAPRHAPEDIPVV